MNSTYKFVPFFDVHSFIKNLMDCLLNAEELITILNPKICNLKNESFNYQKLTVHAKIFHYFSLAGDRVKCQCKLL